MKKHAAQFYDFELVLCWFHRLYKKYIADIADLGKANTQLEGDIAYIRQGILGVHSALRKKYIGTIGIYL